MFILGPMHDEHAFIQDGASGTISPSVTGAIVAASTSAVALTAVLHPASGRALLADGHDVGWLWYLTHFLGVGVWPVFAVGIAGLGVLLGQRRGGLTVRVGTAFFVVAAGAAMGSGLLGGFVRPQLASAYQAAPAGQKSALLAIYDYNTVVNETFADAYQVAVAVSIALLGVGLLRLETVAAVFLGWGGVVLGTLVTVAFATGLLSVKAAHLHVFVGVNLAISAWFALLAVELIRSGRTGSTAPVNVPSPAGNERRRPPSAQPEVTP